MTHPLTDDLQQQIDAEELWEKQHPLTDEICHQITWAVRYKTSDENDMRHAADWQLEEVIEWLIDASLYDYLYRSRDYSRIDKKELITDLKKAMRPKAVDLPQANSDVCGEEGAKRAFQRTIDENGELMRRLADS